VRGKIRCGIGVSSVRETQIRWASWHPDSGGFVPCPFVDLGEFAVGAGQADLEAFDLAEPALSFGFGDAAWRLSRISTMRLRWAGSGQCIEHRRQAWS
jgi:hypothetical protein